MFVRFSLERVQHERGMRIGSTRAHLGSEGPTA